MWPQSLASGRVGFSDSELTPSTGSAVVRKVICEPPVYLLSWGVCDLEGDSSQRLGLHSLIQQIM